MGLGAVQYAFFFADERYLTSACSRHTPRAAVAWSVSKAVRFIGILMEWFRKETE